MSNVYGMFITPLLAHFHEPESEFLNDLAAELDAFSDAALVEAARQIKRTHTRLTFPRLADCLRACEAAAAFADRRRQAAKPAQVEHEDWLNRQAHAKAMLKGQAISREAARDQWFAGLHDFVADKGRLPVASEIAALRKRSIENHRVVVESQDHRMLGKLATSMVGRYAKHQQEACQ